MEKIALERFFAADLLTTFSTGDSFMHFGPDAMPRLHKLMSHEDKDCLSLTIDWKSFDTSIKAWMIEEAFYFLERLIDFTKIRNYDEIINLTETKSA